MSASSTSPGQVRYLALIQLLRTADTLWNASRAFFTKWDLSPSQFNVLNLLFEEAAGFSQIELGRLLLTHRSNVTGLVDRLEKRGLVARNDAVGDRRAYRVVLTAAGRKLLQQILPDFHALADSVWDGTSIVRTRKLSKDLARLAQNAEQLTLTKEKS